MAKANSFLAGIITIYKKFKQEGKGFIAFLKSIPKRLNHDVYVAPHIPLDDSIDSVISTLNERLIHKYRKAFDRKFLKELLDEPLKPYRQRKESLQ